MCEHGECDAPLYKERSRYYREAYNRLKKEFANLQMRYDKKKAKADRVKELEMRNKQLETELAAASIIAAEAERLRKLNAQLLSDLKAARGSLKMLLL